MDEVLLIVYRMSASELELWHTLGGDIPADHGQLFKLRDSLRQLAATNGTRAVEPPVRAPAGLTKRKATG